jgi:thiol:disulfide interchange protein DsbC
MTGFCNRRSVCKTVAILVLAVSAAEAGADTEAERVALPGTAITSRAPSVIDGLVEVVAGDNVLYVDEGGRYLVIGSIYDLHEDRDLSAERRAEVRRSRAGTARSPETLLEQLPNEATVITGAGDRLLTVIMDPDCGWCRRLWAESLRDLPGAKVRHVLPRASEQIVGILCASDPAAALRRALDIGTTTVKTPVPTVRCRREVSEKIAQAAQLVENRGLSGTPILIREDGAVHAGYLGRTALLRWLDEESGDAS